MPLVNRTFTTRIKSDKSRIWDINVSDIRPGTVTATGVRDGAGTASFDSNDFTLSYKGEKEDPLDPIKSSSLKFNIGIVDSAHEGFIEDIFNVNFDVNWYVSLWLSVDGGSTFSLYWWGYLSPLTAHRPNEYYPFDYQLEALDILAISQNTDIWGNNYSSQVFLPPLGVYVWLPFYRFGEERTATSALTLYPKKHATVIETIYSLLYDLDTGLTGNLNAITYWTPGQTPNINTGPLNHCTINTWWYLYEDMPVPANTYGVPLIQNEGLKWGEIMRDICNLFCLRIFQKDGEYWVVQPEAYQTGAAITQWKYKKGPVAFTGNHPVTNGSRSLATSDYLTAIAIPQTDPEILEGSYWSKLKSIWGSYINGFSSGGSKELKMTRSISGSTHNLSDLSREEIGFDTVMGQDKILYSDRTGVLRGLQDWSRGSGGIRDTYDTSVSARLELSNKFRTAFEGTIFASSYNFFKGISYDSKTYIPHSMTLQAGDDHFKCKWVECRIESGGLGDVITEYLDPDA